MESRATKDFWICFNELPKDIQKQAKKTFSIFKDNPTHPGLQFKKVNDEPAVYSVRISLSFRALATKQNDIIIWFWIGNHEAYEKYIRKL
jgi:hypothetical protein